MMAANGPTHRKRRWEVAAGYRPSDINDGSSLITPSDDSLGGGGGGEEEQAAAEQAAATTTADTPPEPSPPARSGHPLRCIRTATNPRDGRGPPRWDGDWDDRSEPQKHALLRLRGGAVAAAAGAGWTDGARPGSDGLGKYDAEKSRVHR